MSERLLLIDYENIHAVDLKALPADVEVRFVLGGTQASLPTALAIQAHALGERFRYVRILSVERNACDFGIAYYLGEYLHANPQAECVILTKDKKGFDPLVKHLTAERGYKVRRVNTQKDAFGILGGASETPFARLKTLLNREKTLPRMRTGLEGKVKSWFPDLSADQRSALVKRLFEDGIVSESEGYIARCGQVD